MDGGTCAQVRDTTYLIGKTLDVFKAIGIKVSDMPSESLCFNPAAIIRQAGSGFPPQDPPSKTIFSV